MITLFLLGTMAIQPISDRQRTCATLAPAGEAIVFAISPGRTTAVISPAEGSAWPDRPVAAQARPGSGGAMSLVVGGEGGVVIDVAAPVAGQQRTTALVSRWNGRSGVLPLAHGFCIDSGPAVTPQEATASTVAATNIPAFDSERWPLDCALLLGDGERHRLVYRRTDSGNGVSIQSATLWSGRTIDARLIEGSNGARFTAPDNGPRGYEFMRVDNGRASKVIHFQGVGGGSAPDAPGYAICGYSRVERRPNVR